MIRSFYENLIDETTGLADRIVKISCFIESDEFGRIPTIHRNLIRTQKIHMLEYLRILNQRIAAIDHENDAKGQQAEE